MFITKKYKYENACCSSHMCTFYVASSHLSSYDESLQSQQLVYLTYRHIQCILKGFKTISNCIRVKKLELAMHNGCLCCSSW